MSRLVHAAFALRRLFRAGPGFVAALVFGGVTLLGVFSTSEALGIEHLLAAGAWLAIFGWRLSLRVTELEPESFSGALVDFELGCLLLVFAHGVAQATGGLGGSFYPLVYVVVALVASFARRPGGLLLMLAAAGYESALHFITEAREETGSLYLHLAFITAFGLLNLLFTRAEIARVRSRSRQELDDAKQKASEESRMFRLVGAAVGGAEGDDARLLQSSLEEVHHQVFHVLDFLHKSLGLHTCVLLFQDASGQNLRIVELVTQSDLIREGDVPAGSGAVGAVAGRGQTVNLRNIKSGYSGLPYYDGPADITSFLGVPVMERGQLRGALCADRTDDRPFTPGEEVALKAAATQVLRAMENERVFVQLERGKREQTVLHQASQLLGAALDEDAVMEAGLDAAAQLCEFDLGAITVFDPETQRHQVRLARGEGADKLGGLIFADNHSLTAMALKNRHYLPYKGEFDASQQTVFTRKTNPNSMKSALVMPLVVRDNAIGTLVVAARERGAFPEGTRSACGVLSNQLAVSLANAASVRLLEEQATTDGLTGCLNKRTFLEELDGKIKSAQRFGRSLSLIVTDIDHFKSVNDTYGHDVGDVVIKALGSLLRGAKRDTDIVARFGGEEFCVLCEETGTDGAILLAERIREELGKMVFQTPIGELSVKASLGVATFPLHATSSAGLFKASDEALYKAKRGGRDQVCTA